MIRNLFKTLGLALAGLALAIGVGVSPASAANGLTARPEANGLTARPSVELQKAARVQQIVHSPWSDRAYLKVSNYWNGKKGSKKGFVPRGRASGIKPTRSFYVPKGCVARIATPGHDVVSKRPSGWQNLKSPIYALGRWQIELWCQSAGGGGGGGSWRQAR